MASLESGAFQDAMLYLVIADLRRDQLLRMIQDGVAIDEDELKELASDERLSDRTVELIRGIEANVFSHADFDLSEEQHWLATAIEFGRWDVGRVEGQPPAPGFWPIFPKRRPIYEITAIKDRFGNRLPGEPSDRELFKIVTDTLARAASERADGKPHWVAHRAIERMARSPFPPWKQRALLATTRHCPTVDGSGFARNIPALGPTLMAALKSGTPATRSTAAVVIGVARATEYLDALKEALPVAADLRVALSIRFALSALGETDNAKILTEALEHDEVEIQEHAGCLLGWYELNTLGDLVDDAILARVLATKGYPTNLRVAVAELLAYIAWKRPLSETATELVFVALDSGENEIVDAAEPIVSGAVQFERTEVLKRIAEHPHPTVYRALLRRLAQVALPSDFSLFVHGTEHYSDYQYVWNAAFEGMKGLPGEAARDWMLEEYFEMENPTDRVTCHMASRKDWTDRQRQKLFDHEIPRVSLYFKLNYSAPDAVESIINVLRNGEWLARSDAAWWVAPYKIKAAESELWKNLSYHKFEEYPQDAFVRTASLRTLLRLAMERVAQ